MARYFTVHTDKSYKLYRQDKCMQKVKKKYINAVIFNHVCHVAFLDSDDS
jgi:hypothetical protein